MRLKKLVPEELDAQQREVYDAIAGGDRAKGKQLFPLVDADGSLTGPFGVMLHAPAIGGPLQELGSAIRFRTSLSDRVREIAILQVAQALGSEFEWWAHERIARSVGVTPEEITAISVSSFSGRDAREQASYEVVSNLLQSSVVTDEEFDRASAVLSDQELVELSVLVGYYRTLAQTMTLFGVGIPEE
ncbi:carboxymuconolactone decarboxylase family protein [uncultured Aeromicrobium sp.]|uniref:carboxymuconolactone decarboxylase family protein n=1 Tax=uncultured Aeromicrobium sp. TaxID=337820 RepID=UPI0025DDBE58|nr:carboxymuconolactone decarboxylase family protein [uncultured Aeromicrobium sp.]